MFQQTNKDLLQHTLFDHVKLTLDHYFEQLDHQTPSRIYHMVIGEVEKAMFQSVLAHAQNNKSLAATYLGLSRGTLRKKLQDHAIQLSD